MAFMVDRSVRSGGVLLFFFQFLAGDLHRYPSDGTWILPKVMANTLDHTETELYVGPFTTLIINFKYSIYVSK